MPFEVFYSYAHEDEKLRDKLEKQLALLQRQGLIVSWHDRRIGAGEEWRDQIDAHVRSAHIILLLISADFIASDYCYGVEMRIALERQQKHEAVVIPVILRRVDWSGAPFARLQPLPRDGRPVTAWDNQDEAFADVARGIREVVTRFQQSAPDTQAAGPTLVDKFIPKPRVVDAAIPSHVVKDLATQLLVLIRLPDSPGLRGILQLEEDAEAHPEDVRSRPFEVTFPLGPTGKPEPLKVTVKVTSPDFSPPEQAENIFVPPDADSQVCPFMLTPRRLGRLSVLVKLQWEDAVGGHRSLLTKCVADSAEAPAHSEMNLVQMHVSVSAGSAGEASGASTVFAPEPRPHVSAPFPASSAPPPAASLPIGPHGPGALPPAPSDLRKSPRESLHKRVERVRPPRAGRTLDDEEEGKVASPYEPPHSMREQSPGSTTTVAMPSHWRTTWLGWINTKIIVAIISAIPVILGSYWQFVYKPQRSGSHVHMENSKVLVDKNKRQLTFTGQVLNARTREFVPDARITVALDAGAGPLEQYTDSHGNFSFHLDNVKRGTQGRIYVHAPNYDVLEKNFVITDSSLHHELRLEPIQNTPSPPKSPQTMPVIAGRVVDASTNAGVSHAGVSLAGRSETYLTDDNGNFRVRMVAPFPKEGVRLQVKKAGCTTLDQVVRPPAENLMLELRCTPATANRDSPR